MGDFLNIREKKIIMIPRLPRCLIVFMSAFMILILFILLSGCIFQNSASAHVREGKINVAGGEVWYRIVGANQQGTPLIVIHGGPGAPHDYLEPLEALGDERPVIFYDQLGCGNSDLRDDHSLWTLDRFVEELELVREELAPGEVHILGQSWGTMLALEYMITKKSDGVKSLILSAPCLSAKMWEEDQRNYLDQLPDEKKNVIIECEKTGDFGSQAYQDVMMEYYHLHVCRLDPWPDSLNRTFEKMGTAVYNHMWGPSEFTITGTLRDFDRTRDLHEITVPVLFTCGQYDEATPESTSYYQSMLPGSELTVFENASHMHHIEKTDEYLLAIRDFLRRSEEGLSSGF